MKIIVSTSNNYLHILPIFIHLFQKFWGTYQNVEIVGYDAPAFHLPDNFSFHSMGKQIGDAHNFSGDLRKYFERQEDVVCWMMEDTFLKAPVNFKMLELLKANIEVFESIGRISLSADSIKFYTELHYTYTTIGSVKLYKTPPDSDYRLSLQPAIWNKDYLLKYLTPGMTPWQFENQNGTLMQTPDHEFLNLALDKFNCPVQHNEGVRKRDLYAYDFNGIPDEVIQEMKELKII